MFATRSTDKRRRAASFSPRPGPTPDVGPLDVHWASPFDRACYLVSTPGLAEKHRAGYNHLMRDLTHETGCTPEEIMAHGRRVRNVLAFAKEQLARAGALAHLVGTQKLPYDLHPVTPAF
jgi:hypothetical protein